MQKLVGFLRLMRPANIVTAISDILAGVAIANHTTNHNLLQQNWSPILLVAVSTIGLYGGGVVLNDVFDAKLDIIERPERPIPSGIASKKEGALLASFLFLMGIVTASFVHPNNIFSVTTLLAGAITFACIVYDKWGKHHSYFGPVNMGLCRGLNLLLGISILPAALNLYWPIFIIPVLYIAAITMISRGEVHGGKKSTLYRAVILYSIVILSIIYVGIKNNTILYVLFFLLLFGYLIFPPLQKAIREPKGSLIGKAVKAGVIALIVMNASWAAAFGSFYFALFILLLLPVSFLLAKAFAVT
ncbi:MAG: UbiA-like protein EboC [Segetibacter sp.]